MLDAVEKVEKINYLREVRGLSLKEAEKEIEEQEIAKQIKNAESIEDLKQVLYKMLDMI